MKNYIEIWIDNISQDLSDILVAELAVIGFDGFEQGENHLAAYIPEKDFNEAYLKNIISIHEVAYNMKHIEEKNWNEEWEKNFEPVRVGDFVAIRADFHPEQHVRYEIVITPKMSFGTGHHATTYLMLQQMQEMDFAGKEVFDFGTGTGILAILAEKLGAAKVIATDSDEWSIRNAAENLERNLCRNITLLQVSLPPQPIAFDIILANINKNVILQYLPHLATMLRKTGRLLFSGLLEEDEQDVLNEGIKAGLKFLKTVHRGRWIAIEFIP